MSNRRKKYKPRDKHHRKPRSIGGDNSQRNVISVPRNQHQAWHLLFSNLEAHQIADMINAFWLDPDYEFIVTHKGGTYDSDVVSRV